MALPLSQPKPFAREPLASMEGLERLIRSRQYERFFRLANFYQFQPDRFSCGPTSAAMVMNGLRYATPRAPEMGPGIRAYSSENILNEKTQAIKTREEIRGATPGLTLTQLKMILETHATKVEKIEGDSQKREANRRLLIQTFEQEGIFIVANFARETGEGHFSPLIAYDAISNSVLILDTNPSAQLWSWVDLELLFDAMETRDGKEYRGFLLVSER